MPVYRYEGTIAVNPGEPVILTIDFPDNGTAASHEIDLPGPEDMEGYNEIEDTIAKGADLIGDRVVVWTKAFNLDSGFDEVRVDYSINGQVVLNHKNKKSEDTTPQIKLVLSFQ